MSLHYRSSTRTTSAALSNCQIEFRLIQPTECDSVSSYVVQAFQLINNKCKAQARAILDTMSLPRPLHIKFINSNQVGRAKSTLKINHNKPKKPGTETRLGRTGQVCPRPKCAGSVVIPEPGSQLQCHSLAPFGTRDSRKANLSQARLSRGEASRAEPSDPNTHMYNS